MRLTPADVHNVAFKKPSIGKRGYDEDEVDAFLDLVEAELARLIEENNELNQRLAAQGSAPADHHPDSVEAQHQPVAPVSVEKAPEPAAAPQPVVSAGPAEHHVAAAKLLGLAQETAERLTGDAAAEAEATRASAKADSEKMLGDAKQESERLLTDAKNQSETMVREAHELADKTVGDAKAESERLLTDAKNRSETMVSEATTKAEALERDSRVRADAMDREAQGKYSQVMGQLTEQRTSLEKKIDDLHLYEREYRSRLKGWITDQLGQLDEGNKNNGAAGNAEAAAQEAPAEQHS